MSRLRGLAHRAFDLAVSADTAVRYLWLNVLWLAVSLTIVGFPAATVAMHAVVTEWSGHDERPVAARFFDGIRRHGRAATLAGLIGAAVASLTVMNLFVAGLMGGQGMVVVGVLGAVALTVALLGTALPVVLVDGERGFVAVTRAAALRVAGQPGTAALSLLVVAAVTLAALAFPPSLLLLPAPCSRLLLALRSGRRPALHLPRTRSERTYA
jgi:uncharacterized membrane protein YesL